MGYEKQFRATLSRGDRVWATETLGSTSGSMSKHGLTVITATATGLVYGLKAPEKGLTKRVVLDYTGATGNVTIANAATGTVLNGSTANVITVSSSEQHAVFDFMGLSTSAYSVMWSVTPTTASPGVTFSASTVVG